MKKTTLSHEEIKMENELLRLKLKAETGMSMSPAPLPPALEHAWLNHILKYEEQHKNARKITVHEYLGNPVLVAAEKLHGEELSKKLAELISLLEENNLQFHTICGYEDEIIYKFITEELMHCEIDDIRIAGAFTCFIYEEFHPNHEFDIEQFSIGILKHLISKDAGAARLPFSIAAQVSVNGTSYSSAAFYSFICSFQELHESLFLKDYSMTNVICNPESGTAQAHFEFGYEMKLPGVNVLVANEKIAFHYAYDDDVWALCAIESVAFGKG